MSRLKRNSILILSWEILILVTALLVRWAWGQEDRNASLQTVGIFAAFAILLLSIITHVLLRHGKHVPEESGAHGEGGHQERNVAAPPEALSQEAQDILIAAVESKPGVISRDAHLGGFVAEVDRKTFYEGLDPRETALWIAAIDELWDHDLVKDINGEGTMFRVTHVGFKVYDQLRPPQP